MNKSTINVLFVCTGNICRSPLAEAVFRHHVNEADLQDRFNIDSAGTAGYHVGDTPDPRSAAVALLRGIELTGRARQLTRHDLESFDYVIVMDVDNQDAVQRLAQRHAPRASVRMFREFDPDAGHDLDVPDPYYGGTRGFEDVHDIVDRSALGLLQHLIDKHQLQ